MRKRTAVVADDITGANDIGGMYAKSGYVAGVFPWSETLTAADFEGLDTVVVDTDSRFDDAKTAYDKVYRATQLLQRAGGFDVYFKKTCSVFRGNIGAEFDAMQDALGVSCSMVVLGFPANGRTTLHGIHYVNGTRLDQSSFVRDPIHPTLEPELTKILAKQTDRPGAVFPYEWYGLPLTEQKEKLDDLRRENAYIVFDVRDQTDLHGLAVLLQDEKCLCGSSAIGQELPLVWGPGEGENPSPVHPVHDDTGTLLLAGSLTPQTSGQVEYLLGTGMASAQLDTMALFDPESRREQIDTLTRLAVKETGMGFPALICTEKNPERVRATKEAGYARGMSDEEVGRLVSETLAEIARGTLEKTGGRKLVVAGGDTSATISRRLGVRKMVILDEIEPGVPTMYGYGDLGELLLVLKSGSFGSEPFLEKAARALCALQKGGAEKGEK